MKKKDPKNYFLIAINEEVKKQVDEEVVSIYEVNERVLELKRDFKNNQKELQAIKEMLMNRETR